MKDLISVIVPAYNVDKYIEKCLDSILNQSYKNIEVIVIDDGSSDNTFSICQRYCGIDSRVKLVHQENSGVSAARNHGLKMCSGTCVLFVDADDWIESSMIEELYDALIIHNADLVVSNYFKDNINSSDTTTTQSNKDFYLLDKEHESLIMLASCFLNPNEWPYFFPSFMNCGYNMCSPFAKMYRTSFIKDNKLLFNELMVLGEDQDFNMRFVNSINRICYCTKPYYHYTIRIGSASHNSDGLYEKHINTNNILYSTIRDINSSEDLIPYWNAHMVENIFIILRNVFNGHISFKLYMENVKRFKQYLFCTNTIESLNSIDYATVLGSKKKLILKLLKLKSYSIICFLFWIRS